MGAWGHGGFDNDDAWDLIDELTAEKTWYPAFEAIDAVIRIGEDYLEEPWGARALAAAEVIAAALGRPATKLPAEVADWVASRKPPRAERIEMARRVVARILKNWWCLNSVERLAS